jgi:hypothetical protein
VSGSQVVDFFLWFPNGKIDIVHLHTSKDQLIPMSITRKSEMKFDEKEEIFTLETTGRTIEANRGILGVSAHQGTSTLFEGYDSNFVTYAEFEFPPLTKAERQEIAAYMIQLWFDWVDKESSNV